MKINMLNISAIVDNFDKNNYHIDINNDPDSYVEFSYKRETAILRRINKTTGTVISEMIIPEVISIEFKEED